MVQLAACGRPGVHPHGYIAGASAGMFAKQTGRQRKPQAYTTANAETPIHVELAAEAIFNRWTREQVIDILISRIKRDRRYLAYRKACNRRTSYDDQVQQDMRALALAAVLLEDEESGATTAGATTAGATAVCHNGTDTASTQRPKISR